MYRLKKILLLGSIIIFLSSFSLANGLYFNSIGSKALAMGGAFIGLANDYSAVFWNPAGIAFFNTPRFGLHLTDIINSMKYWNQKECGYYCPRCAPCAPEVWVNTKAITHYNSAFGNVGYFTGLAAYYHPLSENLVAGIGIYSPAGFGVDWDKDAFVKMFPNIQFGLRNNFSMTTISPAIAFKLGNLFSFGGTFNFNYASMYTSSWAGTLYGPSAVGSAWNKTWDMGQFERQLSGWGFGTTVGVMISPFKWLSLGGTVRYSSKIKFNGSATMQNINVIPWRTVTGGVPNTSDATLDFTPPMWAGAGIALKPAKNLTLTADIQWTNWKKLDTLDYQYHPNWMAAFAEEMTLLTTYKTNTHDMLPHAYANMNGQFHWKDTVQYRAGIEYVTGKIAWRAGYYNNPSPVPDQTLNIFFPDISLKCFSFGIGFFLGKLDIDLGFEYLIGDQRTLRFGINNPLYYDIIQDPVAGVYDPAYAACTPGTYNLSVFVPTVSIVYRFGSNI